MSILPNVNSTSGTKWRPFYNKTRHNSAKKDFFVGSISRLLVTNMISRQKTRVAKCNVATRFPAKEIAPTLPSPEALLPPHLHPDSLCGRTDVRDVTTKISWWTDFPKHLTHGSPLAYFARLSSAIKGSKISSFQ